uniref:hypothetical protein n=1 Tax=Castellaniella defragrans TaxID=75697 RepID=UPI00333F83AA
MTATIESLRFRIGGLGVNSKRKEMAEIAFDLMRASLLVSPLSDEIFSLYMEIFSDPEIFSRRGVENFIHWLYSDFEKLTAEQKTVLLETLISHSKGYADQNLGFAVGDMIARQYSLRVALTAFRRMWSSGDEHSRFIAQFGADVLSLCLPKEGKERHTLHKFGAEMGRK